MARSVLACDVGRSCNDDDVKIWRIRLSQVGHRRSFPNSLGYSGITFHSHASWNVDKAITEGS